MIRTRTPFFTTALVSLLLVTPAFAESPAKGASKAAPTNAAAAPTNSAAAAPADSGLVGGVLEPPAQDVLPPGFTLGPKENIELGEGLALSIPAEHGFVDAPRAKEMLRKGGNKFVDGVLGAVLPIAEDAKWAVVIRFSGDGYIKDDEALDAKEILESIKEGTEEMNEDRKAAGVPALFVDTWFEEPHYDRDKHQMIWGLNGHSVEEGAFVNYNTHVLGRRGYVSLNLVSDPTTLATDKLEVARLLAATKFKEGDRYEDFKPGTDKVAEYGLAGLILGGAGLGAAKLVKLGFFAKFFKVFVAAIIAGKKAVIALIAALVAFGRSIIGAITGKKNQNQNTEPPKAE